MFCCCEWGLRNFARKENEICFLFLAAREIDVAACTEKTIWYHLLDFPICVQRFNSPGCRTVAGPTELRDLNLHTFLHAK